MHQAKGREWPVVFVPRLVEGELPLSNCAVDEERRLAYVALSRAKRQLFLLHTARDAGSQPCTPSRFLLELPPELLSMQLAG